MINIQVSKSARCFSEYSIYISFNYNADIVNTIKTFPTRYYDKDTRRWELPLNKLGELTEKLGNETFYIKGDYVTLKKPKFEMPEGFAFKTSPFNHQRECFEYGMTHDRWLLGDQMGLGKTKESLDIAVAKKLTKGYKHCLIICGVNGLKWNWLNEVSTHTNETAHILGQKVKNGKMQIGSNADKLSDLDNIDMIKSYFIITNIETLRSEAISDKLNRLCKDNTIGMCICDESHKVNNPQAQQTKGFLKIQPEYRLAMTGTPLMNRPTDLYVPLKWLGYESHAFYSFKKHYCKMGGFGGYEVIGYKNLDELQEKLNSIMLRRLKDNVLDLPEKTFIDEFVEMTPKQAQVYNEVSWDIKANIDMIKKSNNPLAQLIRLRQATGYTGILSTSIKESAKIDRMIEIATEAIENGKKVVVFSNWTDVTLPAYNALATKFKGTYITGEIDSEQRQENVKKFQGDENCKFVVGSTSAMGTGITLTAGTVEIFLDEPWTSAVKSQAIDRCHRIGAKENVTIYTIMAKGTIDEKIHDIVEKKGVMSDAIVDNAYGKVTPEIIDYLLD